MIQPPSSPTNLPFANSTTSNDTPSSCQLRCPQCQYLIHLLASMAPVPLPPPPLPDLASGRFASNPTSGSCSPSDQMMKPPRAARDGNIDNESGGRPSEGRRPTQASLRSAAARHMLTSDDASSCDGESLRPAQSPTSTAALPFVFPAARSAGTKGGLSSHSQRGNRQHVRKLLPSTAGGDSHSTNGGKRLSDASTTSRGKGGPRGNGMVGSSPASVKQTHLPISPPQHQLTSSSSFRSRPVSPPEHTDEAAIVTALQELHYASDVNPLWTGVASFGEFREGLVGSHEGALAEDRPPSLRVEGQTKRGRSSRSSQVFEREEARRVDAEKKDDAMVLDQFHGGSSFHRSDNVRTSLSHVIRKLGCRPALDDGTVVVQFLDVLYVVASVYLCCFALFLLHGPSRPWLINTTTGTIVVVVQMFTVAWTVLRCFVRNRDSADSYVVNDTVCDTAKKYIGSAFFWLDVIVAIPVEWMVVPLLTDRQWTTWETNASVFSFLLLRHFLRCGRVASFVTGSNPIVPERSIFRFLFAGAAALTIVCACAVAFQAWEGPTLAPLIAVSEDVNSTQASLPLDVVDHAAVTTPALFASFDALYWSFTTALSVGYGDITAHTPGGRAIAILTMLAGTALLSIMTAIATSYMANKDPVQQELEERMRKMTSMLEYFEVPWELQRDVIASFPAVMEAHSRAAFLDMIEHLPEICRKRVEGYSRLRLLRRIHLFEGIERDHAFMLAKCLTQRFVAAQETVVQQGEQGHEMYFVVHGMLDVLVKVTAATDEHIVVATIREGSFFGERGLLEGTSRAFTVMAITLTELLVLTRTDFQQIVASVPAILDMFKRNVFKKACEDAIVQRSMAARSITTVDTSHMPWLAAALQSSALPTPTVEEQEGVNPLETFTPEQPCEQVRFPDQGGQQLSSKNNQQGGQQLSSLDRQESLITMTLPAPPVEQNPSGTTPQ